MFLFEVVNEPWDTWWIILIVFTVISFIISLFFIFSEEARDETIWSKLLGGFIVFCIMFSVSFLGCLPVLIININQRDKYNEYYSNEYHEIIYDDLYSLERGSEVSGSFRLGYGYVGTDTYYYFYTCVNEDTYALSKLKCKDDVFLKETEDTHYYITMNKDANSSFVYYNIVIPKGTVVQQYNG